MRLNSGAQSRARAIIPPKDFKLPALSHKEIARITGYTEGYVSKMIVGSAPMSARFLAKIGGMK